jgi:mono/diheme cytochrome c family protein
MRFQRSILRASLTLVVFAAASSNAPGQQKQPSTVWDQVYSTEQAARGEKAYRENCASCHGTSLAGKGQNPPLTGSEFTANWNGRNLGELFDKMQNSMPADRPGKLDPPVNAGILAYILKTAGFPAGSTDLAASIQALSSIEFRKDPR